MEFFSEEIIYKPKAVRRVKKSKKILKSSISSSTSSNSKKSYEVKIFDGEESNFELDNISIDEINNDFFLYEQKNEEIECFNELYDLINAPKKTKQKKTLGKVKRCKNPLEAELKMMEESNSKELCKSQNQSSGDEEEKQTPNQISDTQTCEHLSQNSK